MMTWNQFVGGIVDGLAEWVRAVNAHSPGAVVGYVAVAVVGVVGAMWAGWWLLEGARERERRRWERRRWFGARGEGFDTRRSARGWWGRG